ncbi:MAG: SMC-Scp complex subunit ScpB [Segetibacter sp.]|jgi:segregation and condensation protein B|nr:SMC-Scp complex subunit ScpB [Segetibacter sp.]
MELSTVIPHIEALIFASDKPLTNNDIVELINNAFAFMEERITLEQVEAAVDGIREKYNVEFYPFEVRQSGGGWQFLTKKDFHKTVVQLNGDKFLKRLSNAALETLAIIAYKQPITKGEVEAIRGVNSDYSVQKLLEKELIIISGRNEELPGKPLVYSTSKSFMDYFGINSVNDLPKIKEVLAEQTIEATIIEHGTKKNEAAENEEAETLESSDDIVLTVTDNGELIEQPLASVTEEEALDEAGEKGEDIDKGNWTDNIDEETTLDSSAPQEDSMDANEIPAEDEADESSKDETGDEPADSSEDKREDKQD